MIKCQLPEEIPTVGSFLTDPQWGISQKLDGKRILVNISRGEFVAYGRNGIIKSPQPSLFENIKVNPEFDGWTMDGELMDDTFFAFDLVQAKDGYLCTDLPLATRYEYLSKLVNVLKVPVIKLLKLYVKSEDKQRLWAEAQEQSVEGVVFKDLEAPYRSGKNSNFVKYKFIKDVDCHVIDEKVNSKKNFLLAVYDDEGNQIDVGKVSSLTGDGPRVKVGDVVTVECLYVSDSNRLVQPRSPMIREDKTPNECLIDQLTPLKTRKDIIL